MNNFNLAPLSLLPASFYHQGTTKVAQELLGKVISRRLPTGAVNYYRIVETEAYLGVEDPVCHSYKNRSSARTKPMYLSGGAVYIYIIYGLYLCLNVVTQDEGVPEAVLIRGLEPLNNRHETNGPGKIGKFLELDRHFNGLYFYQENSPIQIYQDNEFIVNKSQIKTSPRIGIDPKNRYPLAKLAKLRFFLAQNPYVSKHPFNKDA